jgi:hypothetical protein
MVAKRSVGQTWREWRSCEDVDRSQGLRLTWNQVLETGGVMVGDRVEIEAEIQAVKQYEAQVA